MKSVQGCSKSRERGNKNDKKYKNDNKHRLILYI